MLTSLHHKKILSLSKKGHSIRNISKVCGHSRNTIRKVLKIRTQPPFKTSTRPSKLDDYKIYIKDKFDRTINSLEIYDDIVKDGYDGSYSTVRHHLANLAKEKGLPSNTCTYTKQKRNENHVVWILSMLQGKISRAEVEKQFAKHMAKDSLGNLSSVRLKVE